ncbi:MAG: GntR family transcriptional regulator [Symbiobacteriia bacterium]
MWFHIDPSSGTPIYRQVADQVRQAVAGGTLRPGDRLPSVRELAVELAINPNTIAKAYQELERDGVIETPRGRGSFIADRDQGLPADARREKLRPAVERLVVEAYHLGVRDEDVQRMVQRLLEEARRKRDNG